MDRNRIWIIASVVAMVAVVVLGGLFGVQPQLAAAASANQQKQSIAAQNVQRVAALDKLKHDFDNLPALQKSLKELQKSVPPEPSLPAFISDLNALAGSTQTTVTALAFSDAQQYVPPVTAPAASGASSGASSDSSTSTPSPSASASGDSASSTPTPAPTPTAPQAPAPVTNSKITGQNFAAIPVKVTVSGSYDQALSFVEGLRTGTRLVLVTGFASNGTAAATSDASGSGASGSDATASDSADAASAAPTSWVVSGYVYVLQDPTK